MVYPGQMPPARLAVVLAAVFAAWPLLPAARQEVFKKYCKDAKAGVTAKGKGAHSNNLMEAYTSPITGSNCYNECKVRVRPA